MIDCKINLMHNMKNEISCLLCKKKKDFLFIASNTWKATDETRWIHMNISERTKKGIYLDNSSQNSFSEIYADFRV